MFAQIPDIVRIKFIDLPRTDSVIVDVFLHRCIQIAHHDTDLHRLGKDGVEHPHTSCA